MTDLTIRSATLADNADVARLCWAYRDLLLERSHAFPHVLASYLDQPAYRDLIQDLPRIHARPTGDILLASVGNEVVGCAMYYPLATPGVTEIKRVYVDTNIRGSGAGRALVEATIAAARKDGYSRMVLDTITPLTQAIALYEQMGFAPCDPFYEVDPTHARYLRFYDYPL